MAAREEIRSDRFGTCGRNGNVMNTEGDLQTMHLNNSDSQDGDDASYHGRIQEQKYIKKSAQKNRWSPGNH
jgi:hypothetical protein